MNKIFKIGALPNYFKGSFNDVSFEVINQFDIYNKVDCIIQDLNTGKKIIVLNEKSDPVIETKKFIDYLKKNDFSNSGAPYTIAQERKVKKFVLDIIKEIKSNNRKNKKSEFPIKKAAPVKKAAPIKKAALIKKAAPVKKQTGSSNKKYDKLYQALPVGKRTSASGKVYYESRENRSDKGVLLGIDNFKTDLLKAYEMTVKRIDNLEIQLINHKLALKNKENKQYFEQLKKQLLEIQKILKELKTHKTELKKLI